MTPAQRDAVVAEALTWVGTPYHHAANVRGGGVDCLWLLIEVYRAVGLIPHDVDPGPYARDYHRHRSDERYLLGVLRYAREVTDPQPGDAVLMRFGRCFSHGGILLGGGRLVHAYVGRRVGVDELGEWESLPMRYFTPGCADGR